MFEHFLISKNKVASFKVGLKNPFGISPEKITQSPRSFNTLQIKEAIDNVCFSVDEDKKVPGFLLRAAEYILKDLFLYMHQTGLYNRQLKLWKVLGSISGCTLYSLSKGLIRKKELGIHTIYFFINPKSPCCLAIVHDCRQDSYNSLTLFNEFKAHTLRTTSQVLANKLKGIFYFLNQKPEEEFLEKVKGIIKGTDTLSRYESILSWSKDTRLNLITFSAYDNSYNFELISPLVKQKVKNEV